jgi:inhibitor of cysteine peptidase
MGRRRLTWVTVSAALLLATTACSDGDSSQSSTTTTSAEASAASCTGCPVYGDGTTSISARAGDEFVIELESNASTGYQWTATSSDETVVSEQSDEYVQPSTDALGAPGSQRFVFAASSVDGADARQIAYTVTVT